MVHICDQLSQILASERALTLAQFSPVGLVALVSGALLDAAGGGTLCAAPAPTRLLTPSNPALPAPKASCVALMDALDDVAVDETVFLSYCDWRNSAEHLSCGALYGSHIFSSDGQGFRLVVVRRAGR